MDISFSLSLKVNKKGKSSKCLWNAWIPVYFGRTASFSWVVFFVSCITRSNWGYDPNVARCLFLKEILINHILKFLRKKKNTQSTYFAHGVCNVTDHELRLCARHFEIVIFDTSAKKCFYPREDVCARAKRGWKGHTRIKSLSQSRIEHNFFIRRVQSLI